jgi:hypothetical protein
MTVDPAWWELVRSIIAAVLGWLAGWKFPPTSNRSP